MLLCLRLGLLRGPSGLLRLVSHGGNHLSNHLGLLRCRLGDHLRGLGLLCQWLALCLSLQGSLARLTMFAMTLPAAPATPAAVSLCGLASRGLLRGWRLAIHLT